MSRFAIVCGILAAGGLLTLGWSAPAPEKKAEDKPVSPAAALEKVRAEFPEMPQDPQTKLAGIVETMGKLFDVRITVNETAFKAEGLNDVLETQIVGEKALPR